MIKERIQGFFLRFGRAFTSRNYRLFFVGQLITCTGSQIQAVAMGWLVYDLTNSKTMLGTIMLLSQAPGLVLSPLAGVLMSRFNKRRLLMTVQVCASMYALALAALTYTGLITPSLLLCMAAVMGVITSIEMPTRHSLIYYMVKEPSHLGNAIAMNSMIFNCGRLVGPAIGGFAISLIHDWLGSGGSAGAGFGAGAGGAVMGSVPGHVGESVCFLANSLSYFGAILALYLMDFQLPPPVKGKGAAGDFLEGVRYAWNYLPVRTILIMLWFLGFTALTANTLTPAIARDVLGGDSRYMGMLQSSMAVGAIIAAAYMAARSTLEYFSWHYVVATLCVGIGLLIYSYSTVLPLSCGAMFLLGIGQILFLSTTNTLIQLVGPMRLRDRFISFYSASLLGLVPLGCQLTGCLADHVGVQWAVRICAICSFALFFWYLPNRCHIRDSEKPQIPA